MYQWNPNFQVALDGKLANLNKGNAYALWKNKKLILQQTVVKE